MHRITFYRKELPLGSTPWSGGLESAKKHAVEHMPNKEADRVEVRDDAGKLCFHHPRTLSEKK